MGQETPEDVWAKLCERWEEARQATTAATRGAFSGGLLQDDGVGALNTAYENEDRIYKEMQDFLKKQGLK